MIVKINAKQREEGLALNIIHRTATLLSLFVMFIVVVTQTYVHIGDSKGELLFKASVKAEHIARVAAENPQWWQYSVDRLNGILHRGSFLLSNEWAAVLSTEGEVLAELGNDVNQIYFTQRAPIQDMDRTVGWVVLKSPVINLLVDFLVALGQGILIALLIYFTFGRVPMRALKRAEQSKEAAQELASATLHSIGDAVLTVDTQYRITYANPTAEKLLETSLKKLQGRPFETVLHLRQVDSEEEVDSALARALKLGIESACNGNCSLLVSNEKLLPVEERATPLFGHDGKLLGGVLCLRDVSEKRRYIEQRTWEATHDQLTGLINRREFEMRLDRALLDGKASDNTHVLCYIDLDRFKIVNDTCGHAAGDRLLVELSELMRACVRESDALARVGGDEFALLLQNCNLHQGERIANAMREVVADYIFHYEEQQFTVGMSVGLTLLTPETPSAAIAQSEADSACYHAKENGRDRVCLFSASEPELNERRAHASWVSRLTQALNEERFTVYYQSYCPLSDDAYLENNVYIELLLRMLDEDGKIILPESFLPAAERFGLIGNIDRWVINYVYTNYHKIVDKFDGKSLTISINLSAASVCDDWLIPLLQQGIEQKKIIPSAICFEITETLAIRNMVRANKVIHACRDLGFRFAIDDFGSGAASFGYLRELTFDYLKIDGSYIRNIKNDKVALEMTMAFNRIAHKLGKKTIAEYTEDESTLALLKTLGIDFAQGYAVNKPQPIL
ncbi:EAL domain-containing protein [Vibrio alfacsensis]|uniref:EAL domain-containing protein n=1 Tax=Vibrio alfacsensis TaxID=1074311 RepID=UPI0040678D44